MEILKHFLVEKCNMSLISTLKILEQLQQCHHLSDFLHALQPKFLLFVSKVTFYLVVFCNCLGCFILVFYPSFTHILIYNYLTTHFLSQLCYPDCTFTLVQKWESRKTYQHRHILPVWVTMRIPSVTVLISINCCEKSVIFSTMQTIEGTDYACLSSSQHRSVTASRYWNKWICTGQHELHTLPSTGVFVYYFCLWD